MPDRTALTKLRPAGRSDWHQIRVVIGYVAVIAVVIAVTFFIKRLHREEIEQNWKCATATIEDVQPKMIQFVNNAKGGGVALYEVSILAKYVSEGKAHERWIIVEQPPVTLAEAELETFRWKGQQCVVRWNSLGSGEMIAEVS
ncbi:hypothetical protein [Tunturiibacter gelidoferens]|jgi:hypothetical protein|uniref:Uncharacterized protein n=1 Tax=Tunturiibacter gelidiferens TaxID=3069689 RepID=A0A9X0QJ38_9BACT|nr:hypothetical protein [Edaphobacter lichenicola]MBB5331441.1 hypothetical protein [Edaphobacter lichenicola]